VSRGRAPQLHSTLFEFVRLPANLRATTALIGRRARAFTVTAKGRQADGDRGRTRPPALLSALLVLNVIAAGWYVASILGRTPVTYAIPWVAHGSAFWLTINSVMLVLAVRRIRHERFGADRRAAVRFDLSGTVAVFDIDCQLRDVSLTGVSLTTADGLLQPDRRVRVTLNLAGVALGLDAVVRTIVTSDGGDVAGLQFDGLDVDQQATLALALFGTGIAPTLVQATVTAGR
jgi:hypothetical protein